MVSDSDHALLLGKEVVLRAKRRNTVNEMDAKATEFGSEVFFAS